MFIVLSNALIPICFHNLIISIPNTLIAGWNNTILCTRSCYYGHQVGKANILSLWFPSFQIEWMTCFSPSFADCCIYEISRVFNFLVEENIASSRSELKNST